MKKIKKPTVLIRVPTFNNENTIVDSLNSIINQSYKNTKIEIIDNGSTDNTLEYIKKLKNDKIKISTNSKKGMYNLAHSYNKFCKYDFLCVFHSDDIYHKNIVKELLKTIIKYEKTIIVSTKAEIINEKNKTLGLTNRGLSKFLYNNKYEFLETVLKHYNIINCPTVMINNKIYRKRKKISWEIKKFGNSSDLYFFFNLLNYGNLIIINKILCKIRYSTKQLTNIERTKVIQSDFLKVIKFILKDNNYKNLNKDSKKQIEILKYRDLVRITQNLIKAKNYEKALNLIKEFNIVKILQYFSFSKRYLYTLIYAIILKIFLNIRNIFCNMSN